MSFYIGGCIKPVKNCVNNEFVDFEVGWDRYELSYYNDYHNGYCR